MAASPLANITNSASNYYNRMPMGYDQEMAGACDPMYAQQQPGPYGSAGPAAPVYGPSSTSPYEQFVDPANVPHGAQGGPSPAEMEMIHQQMMHHQQQFYQMQMAYQMQMQHQQAATEYASPHAHPHSPHVHAGHGHHHAHAPAAVASEPCECIYCNVANNSNGSVEHPAEAPVEAPSTPKRSSAGAPQPIEEQEMPIPIAAPTPTKFSEEVTPKRVARSSPNHISPLAMNSINTPSATPKQRRDNKNQNGENNRTPNSANKGSSPNGRSQRHNQSPIIHAKPKNLLLVEGHFKRTFRVFSAVALEAGDHLIYEGDRGNDMGRVKEVRAVPESLEGMNKVPHAVRAATPAEVEEWRSLVADGHAAADICANVVEDMGLPLTIVDAVYQADRNKLTFYYLAEERVDFRRLLSEMFNKFRCRIWLERYNETPDQE